MTDEAVTIGLDDDRIKFFADRLLEVARIKAATEPYEGECDQEDLASYAGEVVKLRRALLDARAEHARVKADAAVAVALMVERAATQADPWDGPVTKNKIVDAQAIAAQQIKARIRALAPIDGLALVRELWAERDALKKKLISPDPYEDTAHPDDHAVNRFAAVMKGKLAAKRLQGRGGWQEPEVPNGYLSRLLREHVDKGDPVDVANLAMMIHQRGERIGPENEGATCGAIERAEADRDRLAAELAQARADTDAAAALALEEAAENKEQLEIWAHEILVGLAFADVLKIDSYNDKIEAHDMVGRGLVEVIRALAPADGLAAVDALRAERDALAERLENEMADLDAADRRNTRLAAANAVLEAKVAGLVGALNDISIFLDFRGFNEMEPTPAAKIARAALATQEAGKDGNNG